MDVLSVCKPSGRNAMSFFIAFAAFTALSVMWGYEGFEDHGFWWYLLLTVPVSVFMFFGLRYEFVGAEQIGVDGDDFVIHIVNRFPFEKDKRIPLKNIKELKYNAKSKIEEIGEALAELNGRTINEDGILLITMDGKKYEFGQDLTEKQVNRFKERFMEYLMSRGLLEEIMFE